MRPGSLLGVAASHVSQLEAATPFLLILERRVTLWIGSPQLRDIGQIEACFSQIPSLDRGRRLRESPRHGLLSSPSDRVTCRPSRLAQNRPTPPGRESRRSAFLLDPEFP
jgi:hypothetical protein